MTHPLDAVKIKKKERGERKRKIKENEREEGEKRGKCEEDENTMGFFGKDGSQCY